MADIELVIKIPEWVYKRAQDMPSVWTDSVWSGIKNGTPLPKGHGDLKDISKIDYQSGCFVSSKGEPIPIIHKIATIEMIRDWLPTIIEADMREVEEMTREEIIKSMSLQDAIQVFKDTNCYGTMDIAKSVILKALEQEPILDKIRAEIEEAALDDANGSKFIFVNRVNQIIDKYKTESEG